MKVINTRFREVRYFYCCQNIDYLKIDVLHIPIDDALQYSGQLLGVWDDRRCEELRIGNDEQVFATENPSSSKIATIRIFLQIQTQQLSKIQNFSKKYSFLKEKILIFKSSHASTNITIKSCKIRMFFS